MRRAAKVDGNQAAIVKALRSVGCSVQDLSGVGSGCPDLLVGFRKRNVLMEIKRPGVAGKKRGKRQQRTNDQQADFIATWHGEVCIVSSVDDALLVLGIVG